MSAADGVSPWRHVSSRHVHQDRWISLRADHYVTGGGVTLDPWYILEWRDWVHVVALTPDDELVLVRQWRPGLAAASLELPGGIMEPGDSDPVATARREFREETGYDAAEFRHLMAASPDPAHVNNRIHFVLALGVVPATAQALDAGEEIVVERHPVAAVLAGLPQGLVQNASHIAGIYLGLRAAGR